MVMRSMRKGASRVTGMHGTFSGKKGPTTTTSDGKDELQMKNDQVSKKDTTPNGYRSSLTNDKTVANDADDGLLEEPTVNNIHKEEENVLNNNPETYSSGSTLISNGTQNNVDPTALHTTKSPVTIDSKKNNVVTHKDTTTDMTSSKPNRSAGDNVVWNKKSSILFLVVGVVLGMTSTLLVVDRTTKLPGDVSVNARSNTDDDEQDSAATDYIAIHKWIQQYEKAYQSFSSSSMVMLSTHENNHDTGGRPKKNHTSSDKWKNIRELEETFETMFVPDATFNYESIGGIIGDGSLQDTLQFLQDYDTIRYMYGWFFFPPWQHSLASSIHDCKVEIIEETIVQQPNPHLRDDDEEDGKIHVITDKYNDYENTTQSTTTTTSPEDSPPIPPTTKVVKAFVHGTFFHPIGMSLQEYNDYMDVDLFPEMTLIVKGSFTHQLEKVPSSNGASTSSWKSVYTEESIDYYRQIIVGFLLVMSILLYLVVKLLSFFVKCCLWILRQIFGGGRRNQERTASSSSHTGAKQESKSQ